MFTFDIVTFALAINSLVLKIAINYLVLYIAITVTYFDLVFNSFQKFSEFSEKDAREERLSGMIFL